MLNSIISEGKTTQEAIDNGLKQLGVSKNQVEIKVIEEKKKSFFSILDPHIVKVEITLKEKREEIHKEKIEKEASEEELEKARANVETFLNEFLEKLSKEIIYEISTDAGVISVTIKGEDSTNLIGYRGEALNALQTIITNIACKNINDKVKVIVDIANYKDERKKTLEDLATKIERTVARTGKSITLEPMTAYERKIIHTKLQESSKVKTHSIGEGDKRRVVIERK